MIAVKGSIPDILSDAPAGNAPPCGAGFTIRLMPTMPRTAPSVPAAAHHSWVGNRETEGRGGTRAVVSPSTGETFAHVSLLDAMQAGEAVEAAQAAFPSWSVLSFRESGRFLPSLREEVLAGAHPLPAPIRTGQGKPAAEAHAVE